MIRAFVLAAVVLSSGCYLGPSRGQRTAALIFNGAIATLGGVGIAVTAVDRASPPDESTLIQLHPDFYAAGGVMIGCALLGAALDLFAPAPRPAAAAAVGMR